MKKIITLLFIGVCFEINAQNNDELYIEDSLSIFMEGVVSTHRNERDVCYLPKSYEIFYTLQDPASGFSVIMTVHLLKGKWSEPTPVPFSGMYNDLEPFITPDGEWMYFSSNRPLADGTKPGFDIWRVKREEKKWGEPENLGKVINSNANEFYPSVNDNGDIYFTAERKDGVGKEDIYVARNADTGFMQPQPLDTGVNSTLYEFNAWVSPDDSIIIFTSYGRKDDVGRGDLYISKKNKNGTWTPAAHLEGGINSKRLDYCPFVDVNGHFYFTSERIQPINAHIPVRSLKEWDEVTTGPGRGSSDIYRVPTYYFRQIKRKALGEE